MSQVLESLESVESPGEHRLGRQDSVYCYGMHDQ
jgi:hypothetical protein